MRMARRFIVIALLLAPTATQALELRGGPLRQDFASLWAAGPAHERDWAVNAELAFDPVGAVLGGRLIPFVGGTVAPGTEVDKVYAGLNWELSSDRLFLRLGLGAALHDGETENPATFGRRRQFGSSLLFHVPVEIGARVTERLSISAYFDHMSNAGLADLNPGLDTAGLRLGWRF